MSDAALNDFADQIIHLDSAIAQSTLHEGIMVCRGVDGLVMFGTLNYGELLNRTLGRSGYTSTSPLRSVADEYAAMEDRVQNPVILKLEIPPGKGIGIYVRDFSDRKDEYEFLLKRNIKYIVSKVDSKYGKAEITARLVE